METLANPLFFYLFGAPQNGEIGLHIAIFLLFVVFLPLFLIVSYFKSLIKDVSFATFVNEKVLSRCVNSTYFKQAFRIYDEQLARLRTINTKISKEFKTSDEYSNEIKKEIITKIFESSIRMLIIWILNITGLAIWKETGLNYVLLIQYTLCIGVYFLPKFNRKTTKDIPRLLWRIMPRLTMALMIGLLSFTQDAIWIISYNELLISIILVVMFRDIAKLIHIIKMDALDKVRKAIISIKNYIKEHSHLCSEKCLEKVITWQNQNIKIIFPFIKGHTPACAKIKATNSDDG